MLAQLRQQTKTILWIVIVTFVGLMVFVWGMNLKSRGGPEAGVVGRVGKHRITLDEYRTELYNLRAAYQNQNRHIDSQTEREIARRAWENIVQRNLLWQEAEKRHLFPTDQELVNAIRTQPPSFIRSNPYLQTDSSYDHQKYLAALQNPRFAIQMESYFRKNLPIQKISEYVGACVRTTTEETRRAIAIFQEMVSISYVVVDPMNVKQDIPDPSQEQLAAFYEEHREDFRVPEKLRLRLCALPKEPSPEDVDYARQRIEEAHDLIEAGEPFDEIAQEYSDDEKTASSGGDMGWVKKGFLEAKLDSVVFSLSPGSMSDIVRTETGFHVFRVEERRKRDGVEEARVSYIFSRVEPSPLTLDEIRTKAGDLVAVAKKRGLKVAADELGYSLSESDPIPKSLLSPTYGFSQSDADKIFEIQQGKVGGPFEGTKAFYVVEVIEKIPSTIPPLEEIKDSVIRRYKYEQRREIARSIAQDIHQRIGKGSSLEAAARMHGLEVKRTEPFRRHSMVPGIGSANTVIATAFALDKGQISGIIEQANKFYIIRVDDKQPMDEQDFESNMQKYKFSLLNTKQQIYISRWYDRLKKRAKIEDYRTFGSAY